MRRLSNGPITDPTYFLAPSHTAPLVHDTDEQPVLVDASGPCAPVAVPEIVAPPTITSITDLLNALRERPSDDIVWFRGHTDAGWNLLPSIARPPRSINAELTVFKRFQQNAYSFLTFPPSSEWEWLFLMQHYGSPTRLLDWTESPLIGLYFAVQDQESEQDGCIWALSPIKLNEIARLKPSHPLDIPLFGQEDELNNYLPSHVHLTPGMQSNTPAAAIAPRQFEGVVAQMGSFTITHKDQTPLQVLHGDHLAQYLIPAASKESLREELRYLRITALTVFPELGNVAVQSQEGLW